MYLQKYSGIHVNHQINMPGLHISTDFILESQISTSILSVYVTVLWAMDDMLYVLTVFKILCSGINLSTVIHWELLAQSLLTQLNNFTNLNLNKTLNSDLTLWSCNFWSVLLLHWNECWLPSNAFFQSVIQEKGAFARINHYFLVK